MTPENHHQGNILIVDDTPSTISTVRTVLKEHGYKVFVATTGETALERAELSLPDLILLDILMPGMDGYETCRQLKDRETTKAIPIIFMTVVTETFDKVRGFQLGAVDYITKPVEAEELLARIKTHLTIARLQQELQAVNAGLEQQVAARTAELRAANAQLQSELAERGRAEKALKRERALIANIMETSPIGITTVDVNGRITFANTQAINILGLTKAEIVQRMYNSPAWRITDLAGHPFPEEELPFTRVMTSGQAVDDVQHAIEWPDGRRVLLSINAAPLKNEVGQIEGMVAAISDITERRRAEEEIRRLNQELEQRVLDRTTDLEAANKELADFSYSVSHDLRAPLRHIDGFLELLHQRIADSLDAQSQYYMDTIASAARRMGTLIDSLLSFYQMRRKELSKEHVDLNDLVREAIQELAPEAADRNIHWQIADLPGVTGDRAMLRIVLVNLIANALKFTRPRQPAEIDIGCLPGNDAEITVYVRDNGVGFDMQYADKLFGVFQRLHRMEDFEGTGIGLANVRRIIARHGGHTWAEGKINHGAAFYFALPHT